MIYPIVTVESWTKKYNLPIKTRNCDNCGRSLVANIPFAAGDWAGFTSEEHECGREYDLFVAVKRDKKARQEMVNMFYTLKDNIDTSI